MKLKVAEIKSTDNLNIHNKDFLSEISYSIATTMIETKEKYIVMHLKPRPKYMPRFIHFWLLKKLFELSNFHK